MLFFSEKVSDWNRQYPGLFGMEDKDGEQEGEGSDEEGESDDGDEPSTDASEFVRKWNLLILIDEVSDLTRLTYPQVFELEVGEFFTFACYARDKAEFNKERREEWQRRNR